MTTDLLAVSIYNYTNDDTASGMVRVVFRVDLMQNTVVNASALETIFFDGLTDGVDRLEPDSIVAVEGINPILLFFFFIFNLFLFLFYVCKYVIWIKMN